MNKLLALLGATIFLWSAATNAQLPDSCKLYIGTNLGGLSDYGSEQPFKNMMHSCRTWYTKDVDNPDYPFNSDQASSLSYLTNGYPTHVPQSVAGSTYLQRPATIWAVTSGWEPGSYVVLFDGNGELDFWGPENVLHPSSNRYTFDLFSPIGGIVEMVILSSDSLNPIQNIRIVKDIYESNFISQPFNPAWIEKLDPFPAVRFMDWGHTKNWGQSESWDWEDSTKVHWEDRAPYDYYTWNTTKGIPYEMMVLLMNTYGKDGWVCVPHNTSADFQTEMAQFFLDELDTDRKLTVEYSNETWNWMFGQAQWLIQYGCVATGTAWPEGTVPYIQSCMNNWTSVWGASNPRLTRAVGVQTGWLDVAQRTVFNMSPGSFDAVAATYYFGINDSADAVLDAMGAAATAADVVSMVRSTWHVGKNAIKNIKETIADSLGITFAFYEGGQHITAIPFGDEPSYGDALLAVQRDTAIYNLYNEWYDFIRTLQSGGEPLALMNFSFITERNARYGSWGLWETMYQDTSLIPAPKLQATLEQIHLGCWSTSAITPIFTPLSTWMVYPNPAQNSIHIESSKTGLVQVVDYLGRVVQTKMINKGHNLIDCNQWPNGVYILHLGNETTRKVVISRAC